MTRRFEERVQVERILPMASFVSMTRRFEERVQGLPYSCVARVRVSMTRRFEERVQANEELPCQVHLCR